MATAAPTKVKERKRAGHALSRQVDRSSIRLDLSQARSRRGIRGAEPRPDRKVPGLDSIDARQRSIHASGSALILISGLISTVDVVRTQIKTPCVPRRRD